MNTAMDWNKYKQSSDGEKIQILKSLGKSDNTKGKLSKKEELDYENAYRHLAEI